MASARACRELPQARDLAMARLSSDVGVRCNRGYTLTRPSRWEGEGVALGLFLASSEMA
jgi:hypothetical protein